MVGAQLSTGSCRPPISWEDDGLYRQVEPSSILDLRLLVFAPHITRVQHTPPKIQRPSLAKAEGLKFAERDSQSEFSNNCEGSQGVQVASQPPGPLRVTQHTLPQAPGCAPGTQTAALRQPPHDSSRPAGSHSLHMGGQRPGAASGVPGPVTGVVSPLTALFSA